MKIAQIAPIIESVPPKTYGGTERVIAALTEELIRMGHEVTLFASGDSKTSARLVSTIPSSLREYANHVRDECDLYGMNEFTLEHIANAYSHQKEFDIIHDHNMHLSATVAQYAYRPVVMTLHGVISEGIGKLFGILNKPYLVSISHAQTEPAPTLNYIGNIYNGLDMEHYPFSKNSEDYLLYVGRISANKGVHLAIDAAKRTGLKLIIAAKLDRKENIEYYRKYIKPNLSKRIQWIGEVNESDRNRLYSKALCFLHPVTWREPFGLTLIEALACGCPVIAFNEGSIPEIIQHGKTGYVVRSVDEMIGLIRNVYSISRRYCRWYAFQNFNARVMARNYVSVYEKILALQLSKRYRSSRNISGNEKQIPNYNRIFRYNIGS